MHRDTYFHVIDVNTRAIGAAVAHAPDAVVPSCPDWRMRDLAFHVGSVLAMWERVVDSGSLERPALGEGVAQPSDDGLAAFVTERAATLVATLAAAPEDAPAWNWWGDPTARWIPRRVAHEMSVHAWDASNALGRPATLDPTLATDGIVEFFDVIMPRNRRMPDFEATLCLTTTDTDTSWTVTANTQSSPHLTTNTSEPDATLRGTANDLLLVLWRRSPADRVDISGQRALVDRFLAYPRL